MLPKLFYLFIVSVLARMFISNISAKIIPSKCIFQTDIFQYPGIETKVLLQHG